MSLHDTGNEISFRFFFFRKVMFTIRFVAGEMKSDFVLGVVGMKWSIKK